MAITTAITKTIDNGCVQVDAMNKDGLKRHFKVPKRNAKKFSIELKEKDKELKIYSNIAYCAAIFAGVFGAAHFTKKIDSAIQKLLIQAASAIGLATVTSIAFNKYAVNQEEILLKKHNAKEIYYRA